MTNVASTRQDKEIPAVVSPYAGTRLKAGDHLKISAYWFATNFLWGPILVLILPDVVKKLVPHYPATATGLVTGLAAIFALLIPLLAGALSDRCAHRWGRRRPYIAVGVVVNVVGLMLMATAISIAQPLGVLGGSGKPGLGVTVGFILSSPSFLLFMLAYTVVQVGNNIASAAFSGVIPDLVPTEQRGVASGYMALMTQGGTVAGLLIVAFLLSNQSPFVQFGVLSLVFIMAALLTLLGIKETPLPYKPPKLRVGNYLRSLWISPRKYPDFAWVWLTRALVMMGFYAVLPFLQYFLDDVVHVADPKKFTGLLSTGILVFAAISGFLGGVISDKVGRKKVVYVANGIMAAISIGFAFCTTVPMVIAAAVVFGLGYGAYISVDWALGSDVLPSQEEAAKEMGVWHISMTLPQSLAGPIAGFLIEYFGSSSSTANSGSVTHYTQAGYTAMFVMCFVCFGFGAILIKNVRGVR